MKRGTVIGLLAAGAALRALALPLPGTIDVGSWKIWSFAASSDPSGVYGVGGVPPERRLLKWNELATTTDYPPLSLYELAAVGRIYWAIDPLYRDSPALTVAVKTPGIVAEALFVLVLLTWGRRRYGVAAEWAALAFWVNPAVLLNGAVLGYLDAQMAVPAVLALLAAAERLAIGAGALAACAVLTKAQAIFTLPAIALEACRRGSTRDVRRLALGGALTAAVVLLPIVLRGAWTNMLQALGSLAGHDMVSGNSLNLWWIATWIARSLNANMGWLDAVTSPVRILRITDWMRVYPDPRPFGTGAVAIAVAWACWRARRDRSVAGAALLAAWCVYAYTMFATRVHENHLYLAVPFMMLAGGLEPGLRRLAWSISTMAAVNLYLFYGLGDGWPPVVDRRWTGIDLSVWLAAVNLGVFASATQALWRRGSPATTAGS